VDVEDWASATILQETGRIFEPQEAVVAQSEALLGLMQEAGAKATWFFLGEVAEKYPALVRKVATAGHELGVHGFHHHQVEALGPGRFRESVRKAKQAVESAGGVTAPGYRAVDFSIGPGAEWALDELLDAGFEWDASLFPIRMPRYGVADGPLVPHMATTPSGRRILRVPVTVCSLAGLRVPFAGGGYLRLLPYFLVAAMTRYRLRRGPVFFYLHPVEVHAGTAAPLLPVGLSAAEAEAVLARHRMECKGRGLRKVKKLLREFEVRPMCEVLGPLAAGEVR
jgi:polysaccharide deacetylase family protein (PEP-CTERM system associated)